MSKRKPASVAEPARRKRKVSDVAIEKSDSFWDELQEMEDRIMRRAEGIFRENGSQPGKDLDNWLAAERELVFKPAIELIDKGDHYQLRVAVAGIEPKELRVEVTGQELLVRGETERTVKQEEPGKENDSVVCISEFQAGALFRSVRFPRKIDPDRVTAELKNGILTVTAAIAEAAVTRKATVKGA